MRKFSEFNQVKVGVVGLIVLALLLGVAVNSGRIKALLLGSNYSAEFAEAGGLQTDDEVMISGFKVGTVKSIDLEGDHVLVEFATDGTHFGDATRASIKTESALGTKYLQLEPAGEGELEPGDRIPRERTQSPYDVTEALADLTVTTGKIDTEQLAKSFDTMSDTFADTPPELREALTGVRRISQTLSSRDEALRQVLAHSRGVTQVLSDRNVEITRLLSDGNAFLSELEARRDTIRRLLVGVKEATDQLSGFVTDNNESLRPALTELRKTLAVLNDNKKSLEQAIGLLGRLGRSLGEAVGGGPFFYGYMQNLTATNLVPVLPELFGQQKGGGK